MKRMNSMVCVVMIAACGLTTGTRADEPKGGGAHPSLGGPAVKDRNVPGVEGTFGEGGEVKKRVQAVRLPPNVFREAMDTIMAEDAPADVRVTDAQRKKFEGWFEDFKTSVRTYQQAHKQEIQDLRRKAGDSGRPRRPGSTPDGAEAAKSPAQGEGVAAARDRVRQIMEGAPKVEDVYTKVWSELTEPQRKAVDGKIAEFRERQAREREENYVRQKAGKKKAPGAEPARGKDGAGSDKPASPPRRPNARPGDGPGAGANITPERRERVMRLLGRLTPEQQDQLIARLEDRLRADSPEGRRAGPKPPPPMDDVNVPPPPHPEQEMDGDRKP